MDYQNLAKLRHQQEIEHDQKKRLDALISVSSPLFDKAATYTNVVVMAGYLGFFTVWSNMSDFLSDKEMLISALGITVSLIFFVFWEVFKMIISYRSHARMMKVINTTTNNFEMEYEKLIKKEQVAAIKIKQVWYPVLGIVVLSGLIGSITLLVSFGKKLLYLF